MSGNQNQNQNQKGQGQNQGQQKKPQQINLQDAFLDEVCKKRIQITIFFVNGFQMKGLVKSFDNFTVLLIKDGKEQLLYKHAITTIAPSKPLDLSL